MRFKLVKLLKDKIIKNTLVVSHKKYGRIYLPYYHPRAEISSKEHEIYNSDGRKMRTFFIRDVHIAHAPFSESKYFIWDRFNIGLDTHFYTHKSMLETMGNPSYRYGMLLESPSIVPEDYKIFEKHKGLQNDFDLIFTFDVNILDKCDNARFVPFCSAVWNQDSIIANSYKNKTKNISFISSDKKMCELHKFRYDLAQKCKREWLADTYGTFDGGGYVEKLTDVLNDYRFNICIENDITPYYFSERFTTALACGTIPIYLGATEIDKFFNPDGIIKITTKDDIEKVLEQCTPEEYERRLPAVIDNIERAKKYYNPYDYMFEEYFIKSKK